MYLLAFIVIGVTLCNGTPILYQDEIDDKVVGGINVTIEEYPYQLSLRLNGNHYCGATLIKSNVVLTANHCVEKTEPKQIQIRAGTSFRESGGITIGVKSICSHPKYTGQDYDVAVILLEKSFTLSSSTITVPLQPRNVEVPVNTMAVVTGWGKLGYDQPLADMLQMVEVPRIDDATCIKNYPEEKITSRMACFGYAKGGKDACHGDSGGPLVSKGKLVGITSWGYGCAFENFPNVYMKISNPEINDHIVECMKKFNKL